jgi:hypothetical protein
LRGEDGQEAQIPGTKNVLWRAFLDTPATITQNRHPMATTPAKSACNTVIATSLRR